MAEQATVFGGVVRRKQYPFFLVTRLAKHFGALLVRLEKSAFEEWSIWSRGILVCGIIGYFMHLIVGHRCRFFFSGNTDEYPQHHNYHGYKQPISFIYFHAQFL